MTPSPLQPAVHLAWAALAIFATAALPAFVRTYQDFGVALPLAAKWTIDLLDSPNGPLAIVAFPTAVQLLVTRASLPLRLMVDVLLVSIPVVAIVSCVVPLAQLLRGLS